MIQTFQRVIVITGHYGSGKTSIAVNLALSLARRESVTLVDLDIVNPYFRSADLREPLETAEVRLIAPVYAGTNLDSPVLPPEIGGIFRPESGRVILDVGGDDAGAIALGQYAARLEAGGYDLCYVINSRRYLTRKPEEAAELLREIERVSRLKASWLINNTNLGSETTLELVRESVAYGEQVSALTGIPVAFNSVCQTLPSWETIPNPFPLSLPL